MTVMVLSAVLTGLHCFQAGFVLVWGVQGDVEKVSDGQWVLLYACMLFCVMVPAPCVHAYVAVLLLVHEHAALMYLLA